jgi:hypothetical protein
VKTWNARILVSGNLSEFVLSAQTLGEAFTAALAEATTSGGTVESVTLVSPPSAALTAGLEKLQGLGLTSGEALALAGAPNETYSTQ